MKISDLLFNGKQKKLEKLKGYLNIDGWLTANEANGLFEIASSLKKQAVVLEIGSWKGKSTYCIATGLGQGTIFCIDPFNADGEPESKIIYEGRVGEKTLLEEFNANLAGVSADVKITPLKGYSKDFVNAVPEADFLFIDGDHSIEGCRFDYENFWHIVKVGGYLAFHDYDKNRPELGPTYVVDTLVTKNSSFKVHNNFDSLFVFKRIR